MPQPTLQCPFCPKTSTRGTGLASHVRGSHPIQYQSWSKGHKSGAATSVAAPKPGGSIPESGFGDVVALLQKQKNAIEAALAALRGIDSEAAPTAEAVAPPAEGSARKKRKGGMSPEGKARLIAALKKRWAARKAGAGTTPAVKKTGRGPGRPRKA